MISTEEKTSHEGAVITLCAVDGEPISDLYFDFSTLLKAVPLPSDTTQDFLLVAATVYSLDKLTSRSHSKDGWERQFEVTIPVKEASKWSRASDTIDQCLSFLSGDKWQLSFTERTSPLIHRKKRKRRRRSIPQYAQGDVACLFSGGLDSLIGAIDWLENADGKKISLVGHHDPRIPGANNDQIQLLKYLNGTYSNQCEPILIGVGHDGKSDEITMRSRSLLFVSLGIAVAEYLGKGTALLIPENGTIALNVPLTPARRGSCSTRTAHPHYLSLLQCWLNDIGLHHPIENPLLGKTKGEAVSQCCNQQLLKDSAFHSVSCAKRGHTSSWVRKTANGCGRCMPCIYRRASLHTVGLDVEMYGSDICTNEVDAEKPNLVSADDLRACLSFLRKNHSREAIAKMLIANGPLPPLETLAHADTVYRAMDEIRQLLRDKANSATKRMAGL